jgi:hypothetical protein
MTITDSPGGDTPIKGPVDLQTEKPSENYKEFTPTSWAIDHGTSVGVLLFFITILGFISYRVIPRESDLYFSRRLF